MHFISRTSACTTCISETANGLTASCAAASASANSMWSRRREVQHGSLARSSCGPRRHTSMSPSGRYVRRGTDPNAVTSTFSFSKHPFIKSATCWNTARRRRSDAGVGRNAPMSSSIKIATGPAAPQPGADAEDARDEAARLEVDVAASGVEGITPSRRAKSSARVADDILGARDGRAEDRRAPRRSPLQARARESATRQHASPRFSPPGWQPRHRGARSPLELLSRERPRRWSVSSPRSRARPRRSEQTAAAH